MMQRCEASSGEPVFVKTFMEVLGSCHLQLEPKEVARLERITQEDGMIEREQFIEFAKRSPAVKEYSMRGSKGRVSNRDKTEFAFKVCFMQYEKSYGCADTGLPKLNAWSTEFFSYSLLKVEILWQFAQYVNSNAHLNPIKGIFSSTQSIIG